MTDLNSYAEFILGTYRALFDDCARQYPGLTKEFNRDYQRLSSAIECHGVRFALDVMPAYRKHFDQCLAKRRLTPSHLLHFGVDRAEGTIPRLLRGLILRVFDRSGEMRTNADVEAIRWIRQLLGVVRKLRLASNSKDCGNAVREFFSVDLSVGRGNLSWDNHEPFADEVDHNSLSFTDLESQSSSGNSADLFGEALRPILPYGLLEKVQQVADYITSKLGEFHPLEWRPRHGPGATSDQRYGSYKYSFKTWSDRLEQVFPYADFAVANYSHVDTCSIAEARARGFYRDLPARMCAVPKTLSTPRLIASEPTSSQWCQQSVRDYFYNRVAKSTLSLFIDFCRQEKNGRLALQASHRGTHSTIDLSSASDRISCWHVERLFRRSPSLLRALQASRSVWIEQDICRISPRYHYLRKYSTMGNATTFPVQSLFFLSLALGAVLYTRRLSVSDRVIRSLGEEQVRVFGDDIIVPDDCSGLLVELLHCLHLKVNTNKTFTVGNFRESCGVDAYGGHDVTTVNILDVPRRASPGSIVSTVDVHNNLCERGYIATSSFLRKAARRITRNRVRFVEHGSGLFGWSSLLGTDETNLRVRHNRNLHRGEIQCLKIKTSEQRNEAEEAAGLLQYFTEAPNKVTSAISTLGYLARRPKVSLTLGWVPLR